MLVGLRAIAVVLTMTAIVAAVLSPDESSLTENELLPTSTHALGSVTASVSVVGFSDFQ